MDDQGINQYLLDTYGSTVEGLPLFKLSWTTGLTEMRKGTFVDHYDSIIIREVTEVRECLKYPFAQDRWVIEVIKDTPPELYGKELFTKYTYEGIYFFQDNDNNALPLNRDVAARAIYSYFKVKGLTWEERLDLRKAAIEVKDKVRKERYRQFIGQHMRSPYFFVLE